MMSFGVVLAFLVAATSAYNGPLMCLRYCGNAEFEPLCGSNGKETKLFNSRCELKNAECGDRVNWILKPMAECMTLAGRPDPVDSFSIPKPHDIDELLAKPFSIKRFSKSSKKQSESRKNACDLKCPQYYLPLCGFDGTEYKIFANLCFLQLSNCKAQQKFTLSTVDKCDFSVRVMA